jgi:hypothetical protein
MRSSLRRKHTGRHLLLVCGILGAAACDLPSEVPAWETVWELPGEETRLGVDAFLPAGVTMEGDTLFRFTPAPLVIRAALSDLCPPCALLGGIVLPKPTIRAGFSDHGDLPDGVLGATLRDGSVVLRVRNGLGFDPLRPGGSARGTLTLTLRSAPDGRVVGRAVVSGVDRALPPGGSLQQAVTLIPGPVGARVLGEVFLDSPSGSPARISGTDFLQVDVIPGVLRVAEALVEVGGQGVDLDPIDLDLAGVDDEILDRATGGRLRLWVDNPFGAAADLSVQVQAGTDLPVTKALRVQEGRSTPSLEYSAGELRHFLGREGARFTATGFVDPAAEPVLLVPGTAVTFRSSFVLNLSTGSGG